MPVLLIQKLGVVGAVHIRCTTISSPEINDGLIVLAARLHVGLAVEVVLVAKIIQAGVVTPAMGCMRRSRHTGIPLACKMGLVPSLPQRSSGHRPNKNLFC